MLKIDFWFDINPETKEVVDLLLKNKEMFKQYDISLGLRSLASNDNDINVHKLIHLARRKDLKPVHKLQKLLAGISETELFTPEEIAEASGNNLYENIIKNHQEHAALNKVDRAPYLCLSHKLFLKYPFDEQKLIDTIDEMLKRDSQVEYCYDDDDCIKQKK